MPLLGTIAAASARGFGFLLQSGVAALKYVATRNRQVSTPIAGGSSVNALANLATQPTSSATQLSGIIADGSFIAVTAGYYSNNSGTSWSSWTGQSNFTLGNLPPGVNGSIAYSPAYKRAAGIRVDSLPKGGGFVLYIPCISSTGVATLGGGASLGGGTQSGNVLYAPAFETFYVSNCGGSASVWTSVLASNGATYIANIGVGSPASTRPGVSDDGYPLVGVYGGGPSTNVACRKYLAADMSSFTGFGNISDPYMSFPYGNNTGWTWCPINGRYYVVGTIVTGSGNQVYVRRSTSSSDPQNLSSTATFTVSIPGFTTQAVNVSSIMEDEVGTLWISGWYTYISGKSSGQDPYTYYSTDGGVSWTIKSGIQCVSISKNFT